VSRGEPNRPATGTPQVAEIVDRVVKPASDGNYADWHSYSAQGRFALRWR
jgi:hypothetical protein